MRLNCRACNADRVNLWKDRRRAQRAFFISVSGMKRVRTPVNANSPMLFLRSDLGGGANPQTGEKKQSAGHQEDNCWVAKKRSRKPLGPREGPLYRSNQASTGGTSPAGGTGEFAVQSTAQIRIGAQFCRNRPFNCSNKRERVDFGYSDASRHLIRS